MGDFFLLETRGAIFHFFITQDRILIEKKKKIDLEKGGVKNIQLDSFERLSQMFEIFFRVFIFIS
jgi:hypothetical protein